MSVIPVIPSSSNQNLSDAPLVVNPAAMALITAEQRVNHYVNVINAKRKGQLQQHNGPYFNDEKIVLKDGGTLRHLVIPDGSLYFLRKQERWMFLERSADDQMKTLYVCDKDDQGRLKVAQRAAFM